MLYSTSFGWLIISFLYSVVIPLSPLCTFLRWLRTFGVLYKRWRLRRSNKPCTLKHLFFASCKTFKGTVSKISYLALLCHLCWLGVKQKDWVLKMGKAINDSGVIVFFKMRSTSWSYFVIHSQTHLFTFSRLQIFHKGKRFTSSHANLHYL